MKINLKTVAFIIIFTSLLEPDYFTSIPVIHGYYIAMRIITLFIAIVYFFMKDRFPKITILIIIYYTIYGYSTYLNNGDLSNFLAYSTYIISFVAWLEITLIDYTDKALYSLNFVYSAMVYVNIVFYYVFPNGYMQLVSDLGNVINRYFLGVENQFAATLIPAVIVNVLYNYRRYDRLKLNSYILITVVTWTFIVIWSATSVVGITLIVLFIILSNKGFIDRFVTNASIIITTISLYLMIVIFRAIEVFGFIIEDLLEKDLTLSTRTLLWDRAFVYIAESFWFGYGYLGGGRYLQVTSTRSMDSHNTILQLLLQHGWAGMLILIIVIIIFFKSLAKIKKNYLTKFILFSFLVATTMMLTEVYSFTYILLILVLGICSPHIVNEQEYKRNKD